ncbi:ribonuclease P [Cladophialophora carrionii]|uniref:Ribonuclease P n=1 Tax=Cladophialophora carrionii TaxID=86049 RepID=A0A1C1CPJ1_9EURO|nr:ribonuclease P [Cladophialophora carrionii]
MGPPTQQAGQKRKLGFNKPMPSTDSRKRQKYHDARAISVQRPDAAVSATGELNIPSFIKAREFEIAALEKSMRNAKKSLSTKAFQQVPRHMRRRTASHNAKKVPRRLRKRADREMKEDNTPTVTKRTRTPSRKLRIRLDTARTLKRLNQRRKTVRQKKKEAKANAQQPDPDKHVLTSRVPRLKKNTLSEFPKASTKYKKRQITKTWLPTHLWHTKRAHMTRPTEPLWRMAIPLSPTEKSYRPSHRAAGAQGCIAWDTSYMCTVACWGTETALDSMLKALSFSPLGVSRSLQKKWKNGTRFACGWVSERDQAKQLIAPVKVIWFPPEQDREENSKSAKPEDLKGLGNDAQAPSGLAESQMEIEQENRGQPVGSNAQVEIAREGKKKCKTKLDHRIVIRIHPSAFLQFWQELLKVAKMQKPQVLIEDLRFEIGSIDIQGPGSTEALLGVLRPFPAHVRTEESSGSLWTRLAGVNNPSILPHNAMLSFHFADPRLNHPPKQIEIPQSSGSSHLDELIVSWPFDKIPPSSSLLSHKTRWLISNSLPSQKAINRRRALAPPGQAPSITGKDPRLPVILLASRTENSTNKNYQGTWTVLLPWSCVDPVWRSLMYYPLSSGGTPRFGGMNQQQQMSFERKTPWFPGDHPGTEAGKAWERSESEKRFDAWIRRPPKHRIAWERLDLGLCRRGEMGRGWACDWEYLFSDTNEAVTAEAAPSSQHNDGGPREHGPPQLLAPRQRKAAEAKEAEAEKRARRRNTSSPESEGEPEKLCNSVSECRYTHLPPVQSTAVLKNPSTVSSTQNPTVMTVRIMLLDKGTPSPAARIYRLPSIPKPKATSLPCLRDTNGEVSQDSGPQSWPSDGPPPAQPLPNTCSSDSASSSSPAIRARDLRSRWLALGMQSSSQSRPLPKIKNNKSNIPRRQSTYPRESLAKINVLPKKAPPEIVEKWGPDSAFGRGDGEIPKQMPPPPKQKMGRNKDDSRKKVRSVGRKETVSESGNGGDEENPLDGPAPGIDGMEDLLINPFEQPTEWDKHPPCPDAHDLIGFVTSGGYNLAEGRGTAIGGIWVQRLLEGWRDDSMMDDGVNESEKEKERRKYLCIIRNAGESVGRLGVWEVCH